MVHRLPEEAGAGHRRHPDLPDHPLAELHVAPALKLVQGQEVGDVQQHEVGPLGAVVLQTQPLQAVAEEVPLAGVHGVELPVVGLREANPHAGRLLEGGGGPHGEEVVDLFGVLHHLRRADEPAQPPAGDGVGFGQGVAGDGPLVHPGQGGHAHVLIGGKDDVLVHLVGDDEGVVLPGQLPDEGQLLPGEHLPRGVGGVADNDGLGPLAEGVLQGGAVKVKLRRHQRDVDGVGPREDGVRPVVLIEGAEHDDLVSGVAHGHHGGHHGLGAAAGDQHLSVGVHPPADGLPVLVRQGLPQILGAEGDRVLVGPLIGHLGQAVQHRLWGIEVGVALGQVDGSVLFADPGHPPDHGVGKQLYPLTELGHRDAPP